MPSKHKHSHPSHLVAVELYCREFEPDHFPEELKTKENMHQRSIDMVRNEWHKLPLDQMWPALIVASVLERHLVLSADLKWEDYENKRAVFATISGILKDHCADFYTFVSETRISTIDPKTHEITIQHEDAISIVTSDREGKALQTSFYKDETGVHPVTHTDMERGAQSGIITEFLTEGALYPDLAARKTVSFDIS